MVDDWTNSCGRGGGGSHTKGTGMFAASRRGVNYRFWSYIACSGKDPNIFLYQLFRVAHEEIKNFSHAVFVIACTADETKPLVKSVKLLAEVRLRLRRRLSL